MAGATRPTRAPVVICIPSSDAAFAASLEAVLERFETLSPQDLEARVRLIFPRALVRPRSLSGERIETWYAYRDGSFRPHVDTLWHREPGVAFARISAETGEILEENEALVTLYCGAGGRTMVGRNVVEFVPHGGAEMSERVRRAVARAGETHSLGVARRDDDELILVEWVAEPGPDGIRAWYRPILIATGSHEGA